MPPILPATSRTHVAIFDVGIFGGLRHKPEQPWRFAMVARTKSYLPRASPSAESQTLTHEQIAALLIEQIRAYPKDRKWEFAKIAISAALESASRRAE
jgi:hypothetical protein